MLSVALTCDHCGKPIVMPELESATAITPECCIYRENELRRMQVYSPRQLSRRLDVMERAITLLLDQAEAKRGPGRPRKVETEAA